MQADSHEEANGRSLKIYNLKLANISKFYKWFLSDEKEKV